MITQSRSDAARANGAKSRGPVTAQGKLNSSRNSFRHGLASSLNITVLPGERADELQLLLADIIDEHQPQTPTQTKIAEAMALAKWRQMRAWEMSDASLTQEILDQVLKHPEIAALSSAFRAFVAFREIADSGRSLQMMNRYEARYERLYERSLKLLLRLQAEAANQPQNDAGNAAPGQPADPETPPTTPPSTSPGRDQPAPGTPAIKITERTQGAPPPGSPQPATHEQLLRDTPKSR